MASLRQRPRPKAGKPDDRVPSERGTESSMQREYATVDQPSAPQPRRFRLGTDPARTESQDAPTSKVAGSSRIPSARRPSASGRDPKRPPLTHQDKPWGSSSGTYTASGRSASSTSIPSSRSSPVFTTTGGRNVLRRKSSGLAAQEASNQRTDSGSGSYRTDSASSVFSRPRVSLESPGGTQFDRGLTESPVEVHVAMKVELPTTHAQTVRIYPELDRYRDFQPPARTGSAGSGIELPYPLSTHDLPPPTPLFSGTSSGLSGYSGSPSTRFSGSPGPGPYSRDTTPTTSISSQSPGLVAPLRITAPRVRQNSPAHGPPPPPHTTLTHAAPLPAANSLSAQSATSRPPVTRRRAGSIPNEVDSISADPHGLAAVREALTSSSSNSTVRDGDKKSWKDEDSVKKEKKKKTRLDAPPPSPPPRKSSQKFKKEGTSRDEEPSPSKPAREPAQPIMAPASPVKSTPPVRPSRLTRSSDRERATSQSRHQTSQTVTSPSSARPRPPTRPSRDGTPDLQSQLGLPLPVVHSNLSSSSLSERRQSNPLGPGSRNQSVGPSSRQLQQQQADRPQQLELRLPVVGREPTLAPSRPGGLANEPSTSTRRPSNSGLPVSRTPSPGVSTFKSRFTLFGRRTKTTTAPAPDAASSTAAAAATSDKKDKPTRKGPAAGTGHEGYGRVGANHHQRRRSSGVFDRGVAGTMSSQESLELSLSDDPFLQERIQPVVISGGAIIQNKNRNNSTADLARTESNQSLPTGYSRTASDVSLSSREDRTTLWPSPMPRGATPTPSFGSRRPSDSSDSEALAMRSTLAYRRSIQKLNKTGADQSGGVKVPKPIDVRTPRDGVTSPAITSYDTSVMSDDSAFETSAPPTRPTRALPVRKNTSTSTSTTTSASASVATTTPKKLTKRAKSPRRWNFFGRSSSQPVTVKPKPSEKPRAVAATVEAVQSKPVAFYTMIDSEQEDNGAFDVYDAVRDAHLLSAQIPSHAERERRPSAGGRSMASIDAAIRSRDASVQPTSEGYKSPEVGQQQWTEQPVVATPEPFSQTQTPEPLAAVAVKPPVTVQRIGRPSRLPQVGRIPKVVSARPEQTSPKSFSRPFNRISMQIAQRSDVVDVDSVAKGPSPMPPSTPEPSEAILANTGGNTEIQMSTLEGSTLAGAGDAVPEGPIGLFRLSEAFMPEFNPSPEISYGREFLAFSPSPPRKGSQCASIATSSTTNSGNLYSYADATAVVPAPHAPLAEDEVWLEYDDLLGEEGLKVPPSARSSQGSPFYLEEYTERLMAQQKAMQLPEVPTVAQPSSPVVMGGGPRRNLEVEGEREQVPSSCYSIGLTEELDDALESGLIPIGSPFSVTEFVTGYGEPEPATVEPLKPAAKTASPTKTGTGIPTATNTTTVTVVQRNNSSSTTSSAMRKRAGSLQHQKRTSVSSAVSSLLSEDNSPLSQVNLRVGSMTVSKWLTFGHVLFSPARDELAATLTSSSAEEGGGSSLKRNSILVIDGLGNDDWSFYAAETYPNTTFFNLSPRAPLPGDNNDNNRRTSTSFPLTPPNHHQIQYLSHLDRFPFGPESFTAVVYRFPAASPESHYRNIVSEARRVLKPGGFIELSILDLDLNNMGNRSRRVVRRLKERIHAESPDTSLGSAADLLLRLVGRRGFVDIKTCRVGVPVASVVASSAAASSVSSSSSSRRKKERDDRSLAEMMRDDSPVADESITKMVAKVGRWWFTRCYEGGVLAAGQKSVWHDKVLLSECEEWRTSLKLMVCHARVPDDGRSRVASI